jgi:hypothetical protein
MPRGRTPRAPGGAWHKHNDNWHGNQGADAALHEGRPVIRVAVYPGSLRQAAGRVAFPGADWADIAWHREGETIIYRVDCPAAWALLKGEAVHPQAAGITELRLTATGHAFAP